MEVLSEISSLEQSMNRQIKSIRTPRQTIMNKLAVFWNFSCSYIVFFFFLGGRASLNPLQGMSAEPKPVWVRQLREDCTCQHTCHSSRVAYFIACSFRSCSRRCLLITYHPKSKAEKLMHFFPLHVFQNRPQ